MSYFMHYQISAYAYDLMPRYGLGTAQFSLLFFSPMLTAVFTSIPLGALADSYGVKKVVGICLCIALFGTILRAITASYAFLLASMVLIGFAPAGLNANFMKLFEAWFKEKSVIAIGIYYAFSGLGAALALISVAVFPSLSRAFAFSSIALAGIILAWFLFIDDSPVKRGFQPASSRPSDTTVTYFKDASKSRFVWYIALITGFGLTAKTVYLGFLPQALQVGLSPELANQTAAFVTFGGILGCLMSPLLSSLYRNYKVFVLLCNTLAAASILLSATLLGNPSRILFFMIGLLTSLAAPVVESLLSHIKEVQPYIGSAGGIIGTVSLAMTFLIPQAITWIAGDSYLLILTLTAGLIILTVPFVILLPKMRLGRAAQVKQAAESD